MEKIIEVDNISFRYRENQEKPTLDQVSLHVKKGSWLAIIGPNGSGKSTLVKTFNGLLVAESGQITVCGLPLNEENVWKIREKIGMVFQNPDNQFVGTKVLDDVAFGLENLAVPRPEMVVRVEEALKQVNMWDFRDHEPSKLSGGQKQRVAIAGALAMQTDILVLDEATSMLDPKGRKEIVDLVYQLKEENNLTVISITHDIDEAARADHILVMKDGRLVDEGDPASIFSQGEKLIDMGLGLPFAEEFKLSLKKAGVQNIPDDYMTQERLVEWLWTLYSNK